MKATALLLTFLIAIGQLSASRDEAWYEYKNNNYCAPECGPCNYSTARFGQEECSDCEITSMTPVDNVNVNYTFGKGIDTNKNYISTNLMLFPGCHVAEHKTPFYSLSAYHLSDNKWAGSAGTGLRWMPCRSCHIYGFNVFYDVIGAKQGIYNQVGAGLEYLSKTWEAHANGYLPVGKKSIRHTVNFFDNYRGRFYVAVDNIEQTSHGADLEVGKNFYYGDKMRFYMGIGTAWFERSYSGNSEWTFKTRTFLQWTRYLSIELRTYKEPSENWHCQGVINLSVPFDVLCNFYTCGFSDLYSQPVVRNAMIKKNKGCCWITNY